MPREPESERPGYKLYLELQSKAKVHPLGEHIEIKPAQCLSLCPRPCGIALSSEDAWTYLFGEQQPENTSDAILECASTYLSIEDGYMQRDQRPGALRASILGRVPPTAT